MKKIPLRLYKQIHATMPIPCVDICIMRDNEMLLVKRTTEPLKGEWFVPGGRLHRMETLIEAAQRISKAEAGLGISYPAFVGFEELMMDADPWGHGHGTHTASFCFVAEAKPGKVRVDKQSDGCEWFDVSQVSISTDLHKYVRRMAQRVLRMRTSYGI